MHTKKIILSITLFFTLAVNAWQARIIPVAYNQQTGEWSALFRLYNNEWQDFYLPGKQGVRGNVIAQEAYATKQKLFIIFILQVPIPGKY